ncbi:tetratricopeptide repeat protein [Teichococcus vastitatis]|uniref:tetratricopeptide repeat protein n=1 Tax=Teichococcus vastitatis TaxID=2307076 RepID=UPI000E743B42|nr:tetratricopeptide repeat protein [Pseudoroseomonas vastitatis]
MIRDAQGNAVSTSAEAVRAFDHVVEGYLTYRADTAQRLAPLIAADPEFGLAHILKGYLAMAAVDGALVPRAREALGTAGPHLRRGTPRERAHAEALAAWINGDIARTLAIWEEIQEEHPRDVLALRLHHVIAFWSGRSERMLTRVERIVPRWSSDVPGWGAVLACRAFAHEEFGNYTLAEVCGREALSLDPANLWATHAVAHVMEMQGRRSEGIRFLEGMEQHWEGGNAFTHHLWWHQALYHLERREFQAALGLYDRRFRDLDSPLVRVMPDFTTDVQNACSMLFRLELRGVDVGARWTELADKAELRIGDHLSPFTLPHRMMALAAASRWEAVEQMLAAMREAAQSNRAGTVAPVLREAALPVCKAVLAHRRGDFAAAVEVMRSALGLMHRLGGSHAQQDVLEQLFLDSATKAGSEADMRLLLERVAGRHPVPPERRIGYAEAARRIAR